MGTLCSQRRNQGHPGYPARASIRTVIRVDVTLPPPSGPDTVDGPVEPDVSPRHSATSVLPVAEGGLAGGVCALLARQFGLDPLWVRIAFVLLALAGGIGLVLYAALWLVLVVAPATGWRLVGAVGGVVLVVGIPWLLVVTDVDAITGWFAVVLLLAGLALALWQPRSDVTPVAAPTGTVIGRESAPRPPVPEPAFAAPSPVRAPREPSLLGRATLGLAIVVAAVGALVDDGNGGRLHPEQWLGAAALVCGAGLLVGTVAGRARWLVLPAALFAGSGFAGGELARMGIDLSDATGDDWVSVGAGAPDVQRAETGIGDVYVRYDGLEADRQYVVDARAAIGTVYVEVASLDIEVEVRARTDRGHTELDGLTVDDVVVLNPEASGDGRLVVNAWVGVGDVVVYQAYAGDLEVRTVGTLPPLATVPAIGDPLGDGALVTIDPYLAATPDGWIVLGGGEAVIDPDDRVVTGETYDDGDPSADDAADVTITIVTSIGEYRLLPRSLLITPDGRVVDLQAIRESLLASGARAPATSMPDPPGAVTTVATPPVVTVPTSQVDGSAVIAPTTAPSANVITSTTGGQP